MKMWGKEGFIDANVKKIRVEDNFPRRERRGMQRSQVCEIGEIKRALINKPA